MPRSAPVKLPKWLESGDSAFRWAQKNTDIDSSFVDDEGRLARDYYWELADDYSDLAWTIVRQGQATIHRAIRVPGEGGDLLAAIDLDCVGKAWSAEREGAGVQGMVPKSSQGGQDVVLTAVVDARFIDWEYGFTSFLYYPDQHEISLLQNSPLSIIAVNDQPLAKPIAANTGRSGEIWMHSCDEVKRPNPPPSPQIAGRRYYHGTKSEATAMRVLRDGLRPWDETKAKTYKPRGALTPVPGCVYMTPSIQYAAIYALGGDVAGHEFPFSLAPASSPHGYVFEVDGRDLADVQPDEDCVGEAIGQMLFPGGWERRKDEFFSALRADEEMLDYLHDLAQRIVTPLQKRRLSHGEYLYYAIVGKKALKVMPDAVKVRLIEMGAHIAHRGPVMPTAAWRIDKSRSVELRRDASNFFDIAERIEMPAARPNPARTGAVSRWLQTHHAAGCRPNSSDEAMRGYVAGKEAAQEFMASCGSMACLEDMALWDEQVDRLLRAHQEGGVWGQCARHGFAQTIWRSFAPRPSVGHAIDPSNPDRSWYDAETRTLNLVANVRMKLHHCAGFASELECICRLGLPWGAHDGNTVVREHRLDKCRDGAIRDSVARVKNSLRNSAIRKKIPGTQVLYPRRFFRARDETGKLVIVPPWAKVVVAKVNTAGRRWNPEAP